MSSLTAISRLSHIYFGHHGFDHHYYDWFLNIAVQAMAIEHEHRWDEDRALSVNYVQGLDMIQQNVRSNIRDDRMDIIS